MSDLEDKREIRRRRILENSENRLKRIKSVLDTKNEGLTTQTTNAIKIKETCSDNTTTSYNYESSPNSSNAVPTLVNNVDAELFQNRNFLEQPQPFESPRQSDLFATTPQNNPQKSEHNNRHLIIILLACIYYIATLLLGYLFTLDTNNLYLNNIFMPLVLYEVIDLTMINTSLESESSNSTVMSYLMFFLKMRKLDRYSWVLKVIFKFSNLLQDMMVYFFVFVVFELVKGDILFR